MTIVKHFTGFDNLAQKLLPGMCTRKARDLLHRGIEMLAMRKMLRMDGAPDANLTALELLQRTPVDRLDETVRALKKHRPAGEVRQAMIDLIAKAPLSDFDSLKKVFLTHCADMK